MDNIRHSQGRVLDLSREVYMPCAFWAATSILSTASTTSSPTIEITRALGCPLLPVQMKELEKKNHADERIREEKSQLPGKKYQR